MVAVDHRFALSKPAFVSAPSKKSFASVNSPILACNALTSTGGDEGCDDDLPKTSPMRSSNCVFQSVIWLGWEQHGERLRYRLMRPGPQGQTVLTLNPAEFLDHVAALIPPPRKHRHRYFGVLAPNAPWREAVTARADYPSRPKSRRTNSSAH